MIVLWIGGWVGVVVSLLHAGHRSVGSEVGSSHQGLQAELQPLWPPIPGQIIEITFVIPATLAEAHPDVWREPRVPYGLPNKFQDV